MTGIIRVASSAFNLRVASQPLTTGRLMSMRIRSGLSEAARSRACCPSAAIVTWCPLRSNRRESMSRFISLSSTNSIFAIVLCPWVVQVSTLVACVVMQDRTDQFQQFLLVQRAFLDNALDAAVKTPTICLRQILGRNHNHRDLG